MYKGGKSRKRKQKPAVIEPKLTPPKRGMVLRNRVLDFFAEPTPAPELIEDVLFLLAPFVKFNEGITGLCRLRLVSKHWNKAITRLLPNKNFLLNLHSEVSLTKFMNMQSACDEESISRIAFKSIFIRRKKEDDTLQLMRSFLLPNKHWTNALTSLRLMYFNFSEFNEMMERIIPYLPQLQSLDMWVSKDVDNPNLAQDYHPRPESYWSEFNLKTNNIRNESLKHVSLCSGYEHLNPEEMKTFDWNFIRACPNFQSLAGSGSSYCGGGEQDHWFPHVFPEFMWLKPNLKFLDIRDYRCSTSSQELINVVNFFKLKVLRIRLECSLLREFFQKTSDSCSTIVNLDLLIHVGRDNGGGDPPVNYKADENLLDLLLSTVIHPRFHKLKVLHLLLDVPPMLIYRREGANIPVLQTVQDLKISIPNIWPGFSFSTLYCIILPHCFPNLQIFEGSVEELEQIQDLLIPLAKLKNLWKLKISTVQCNYYVRSKCYPQVLQGLRNLPSLTHLFLNSRFDRYDVIAYGKGIISFIIQNLPNLKVFYLPSYMYVYRSELQEHANEKLANTRKMDIKIVSSDSW